MEPAQHTFSPRITRLGAAHREAIGAHLCRLDAADRSLRFACAKVADPIILRHVASIDFNRDCVLGVQTTADAIVAIAEILRCGDDVEVAFSVDRPLQGHGLGGSLLHAAIAQAIAMGAAGVTAQFVHDNRAMRRVFERNGFTLVREEGESIASLMLPGPMLPVQAAMAA